MKIEDAVYAGMSGVGQCTFTSDGEHLLLVGQDGYLKVKSFYKNCTAKREGESCHRLIDFFCFVGVIKWSNTTLTDNIYI